MPRVICTPEIIKSMYHAYKETRAMASLFYTLEGKLNIQDECYKRRNLPNFDAQARTLHSQIDSQFSFGMERFKGLFFFDFDDTILNFFHMRQVGYSEENSDSFYNGAPRQVWIDILQNLRRQNFCVVLLTSRPPVLGVENEPAIKKMVYGDLDGLFHYEIFSSGLEYKGHIINYIREHIYRRQGVLYPNQNVYLVDDDLSNLKSARDFNIQIIRSYHAPQYPLADFIIQMLPLPASPTLPSPITFFSSPMTPASPRRFPGFSPVSSSYSPTTRIPIDRFPIY